MKLSTLVSALDEKFEVSRIKEDWAWGFDSLVPKDKVTAQFQKAQVGLFMAPGDEVQKIYAACFPGRFVLSQIEQKGSKDVLLITKHPFDWDREQGFVAFKDDELELIKRMRINIYSAHTPFDKCRNEAGLQSTAYAFAKAIGLKPEGEFGTEGERNPWMKVGVCGRVIEQDLQLLARSISNRIRHEVKVYQNNPGPVKKIGIITGGGNERRFLVDAKGAGVDTYITGIVEPNAWPPSKAISEEFLQTAKKLNINVIAASHYLTEKYALEFSLPYLSRLGVPAEFIEDLEAWNRLE